ncbi:MAG: hypothetical protein VKJ46_03345 [Leptolyngbyaceae bacterium]|nr:hypothetical protein [Leptolyngbyaceae bacterium]
MFISSQNVKSEHLVIGNRYKLGFTNHPKAKGYQGKECELIAIRQMSDGEPMLSVRFTDEVELNGLFLFELEDMNGQQLNHRHFKFG